MPQWKPEDERLFAELCRRVKAHIGRGRAGIGNAVLLGA